MLREIGIANLRRYSLMRTKHNKGTGIRVPVLVENWRYVPSHLGAPVVMT